MNKDLSTWLEREDHRALEAQQLATPAFIIDANGALWRWNCGWWCCGPDGVPKNVTPLGHTAFRKVPKPPDTDRVWRYIRKRREFTRPFRRVPTDAKLEFDHWQHGRITVKFTDGLQAKCRKSDGTYVVLRFAELNERRDPRTKQCPDCSEWNLGYARECTKCGHTFPVKGRARRTQPRRKVSEAELDAAIFDLLN